MTDGGGVSVQSFWEDTDEADAVQQYRALVNTVEDGIYQLDPEGRIVAVNDAILELTGYDREELLGEHASRLVAEDDADRVERDIRRRLGAGERGGGPIEVTLRTADGGAVTCELNLNLLLEQAQFRGTVGVLRDVSERRRTGRSRREHERDLERERDLNDRILEASPVGIIVLDGDGEVLRINDRARRILGVDDGDEYSLADVTAYDEDGTPLPVDEHPFTELLRDGEPIRDRVVRVELPDDTERWLAVSATAVRSGDGAFDRIVVTGEDVTTLKERERELERRTDELAAELEEIYGRVAEGVVAVDESWRFTHVNERAEEMLGIDADDLIGENAWETHSEVAGTEVETYYREAMATGEPVSFEVYFEPYDAWFEEHVYPSETGLSIYFRDVTDRKEREQELERYETIVETVEDGIYTVDPEGRFTWVNEAYASMLGYDREELIGEHVSIVADESVIERAREFEREMRAGDRRTASAEALLRTKDGDTVPVEATFALLSGEDERVGVARDVSERVAMEQELREERDLVEGIVETSPVGITVVDEAGRMVFANERAEEILGRAREEITSFTHDDPRWDLVDGDGESLGEDETPFEQVLEREEAIFDTVLGVRRPSGERVWLSVNGAPRFADGAVTGAVFALQDVTEQRRMESELREILGRVTDAFYALDEEFRFTHVNDRAAELLQHDADELLGNELWELFPEAAEIDAVWEAVHRAMETQEPQSYELYFDPLEFWVRATVYPSETGVSVYFQDVTERKEYQRELEESERRYRTLVENFPDGAVALFDRDLDYTAIGGELLEDVGVDPAERIGESVYALYPDDLLEEIEPHFEAALAGEARTFEVDYHDRHLLANTVPIRDEDDEVSAGMLVVQDVTERVESERELAALNRLNEVIRTTSVAAATATSREEIEREVCESLVEVDPFAFAWVGHPERGGTTVSPVTDAGGADGYLEEVTITFDDSDTGAGPTGRAIRTGEPQFVHDVREDPSFAHWREAALEQGFQSTAAFPITHEGATYGVLNVYADETHAFDGRVDEMLGQLADLVGHAVHAVQQRKALVSDSVTELELLVRDDDDPLLDATADSDASLVVDRRVPASGDHYVNFVTVRNVDPDTFQAVVAEREYVTSVDHIATDGDEHRFELTMSELPISAVLAAHGGRLREMSMRDGTVRLVAEVPPDADVRDILNRLGEAYSEAELLAQRTTVTNPVTVQDLEEAVLDRLTEKQRSALEAAYFAGYFEWPRLTTGEEVAGLLGVSAATFTQHLRNAELKLFESVLE